MKSGSHVAVEVPAALTVDECWRLVKTSKALSRHCVMLENVNYSRVELLLLNMITHGVLGEVIHGECGYRHDLRANFLNESRNDLPLWRAKHHQLRNANLYPMHGLGPMAN